MKKIISLLLLFSLVCINAIAQKSTSVIGSWNGSLKVMNTELPLVFHIKAGQDSVLSATMDSPKQGAKDIPVQTVRFEHDSLFININAIGGAYIGKLTGHNQILGIWKQSGKSFELNLSKSTAVKSQSRPQEPKEPFPYQALEVIVPNTKDGINLAGTLTLPKSKGPHTAVLLITGSGPQDRDETIAGHKPFLVLADYLTRNGIAILRLDDRGVGSSEGDFSSATTQDFVTDAAAAFAFLKSHPSINSQKVGLIGHSEGALVASSVAADFKDAGFVVLMAGNGVSGKELLLQQNQALLKQLGFTDLQLEQYLQLREAQFSVAESEQDITKAAEKIRQLERDLKLRLTVNEQQKLGLTANSEEAIIAQLSSPWMRYFLSYNPAETLQKLKMPVLALNGTKDLQVPYKPNLAAIEKSLKAGGNRNYAIKAMPELNHLFQTANTGMPDEYDKIEETLAPKAMAEILNWIKQVAN